MSKVKALVGSIPGLRKLSSFFKQGYDVDKLYASPFLRTFPPGHFYSPIPSLSDVLSK